MPASKKTTYTTKYNNIVKDKGAKKMKLARTTHTSLGAVSDLTNSS